MPQQNAATPPQLNPFIRVCAIAVGVLGLASGCTQAHAQATPARAASASDAPVAERAQSTRRVALLIGNSAYSKLRRLDNPSNDVRLIEATLRGLGFTEIVGGTQKGLDVTAGDMQVLLADFGRLSAGAEIAVVYFAGHGLVAKATNEQFLTGVEAGNDERRLKTEALSLTDIMDTLNQFGAANNFVFLDACRESARGGGMRSVTPKRDAANTVILYATAADELAADGRSGSNSPFTKALAEELKVPDQEWAVTQRAIINRVAGDKESKGQEPKPYGAFRFPVHFKVTAEAGASKLESQFWESIKASNDHADFEAYLKQYPKGAFRVLAENKASRLGIVAARSSERPASAQNAGGAQLSMDRCQQKNEGGLVRAGKSQYFGDSWNNNDKWPDAINFADATSFVNIYGQGERPAFFITQSLVDAKYVVPGQAQNFGTMGSAEYKVPTPPKGAIRRTDALFIAYTYRYQNIKPDGASSEITHVSCVNYEITWCGDGVVDAEDGETCDDGPLNGSPGKCNKSCTEPTR